MVWYQHGLEKKHIFIHVETSEMIKIEEGNISFQWRHISVLVSLTGNSGCFSNSLGQQYGKRF